MPESGRAVRPARWLKPALLVAALPAVAILAAVNIVGSANPSGKAQVTQEVTALLAGIPQSGTTLGKPKAPVTLQVFADLECHTVRRFVIWHLPSIINTWVRRGVVRLEYHSLETDTLNEHLFFKQETATLAAGRQNRLWNFVETFVHEQGKEYTDYATDNFLAGIATQIPGLRQAQWNRDREDPLLFRKAANSVAFAHRNDMHGTPAFLIGRTGGSVLQRIGPKTEPGPLPDAASLSAVIARLTDGRWGAELTRQ